MAEDGKQDYYEVLQVSATAEPDTIHRVYRLLAQRFRPEIRRTAARIAFTRCTRHITVLSDPERRAKDHVGYHRIKQERWRRVSSGANSENDFEMEQIGRLTLLEALYTRAPNGFDGAVAHDERPRNTHRPAA